MTHTSEDMARLSEIHGDLSSDQNDDEADNGKQLFIWCWCIFSTWTIHYLVIVVHIPRVDTKQQGDQKRVRWYCNAVLHGAQSTRI